MVHLLKLPSGNWRVIVQANGLRRSATAPTRTAAMRRGAELYVAIGRPRRRFGDRITVAEMIAEHLAANTPRLSPTTLAEYQRVAERIPAILADSDVAEVTAKDLHGHYRRLFADGWSTGTVRRLHELLHAAWRQTAIFHGWADHNPVSAVRKPARAPHNISPPDPDVVRSLLAAADRQFELYLRLAATTGARRGELVALRWCDINLGAGEVLIARSLVYTPSSGVTIRATKTGAKGQRRIALDPTTVAALVAHHGDLTARASAHDLPAPVHVFSHDAGMTPWFPTTPTAMFQKLRRGIGVTGVRLHDLRHYVATRMLAGGESVVQVGARLGHADPRTTMSVYAHWIPARDREAAVALAAELDGPHP